METIFALASGSYHAGVAVVRVSGPAAVQSFKHLTGLTMPPPREMVLAVLKDKNKILDRALAVYFKAPQSFTGEDVVEYHLHGGRAVIDGVLAALGKMEGCRLAQPGEFTRRAFENEKLDLTEAEAIADLIAAETESQRDQALDQLGGGLSRLYQGFADRLKKILAHQEAEIEFPDEDMPAGIADGLTPDIEQLITEIETHLDDNRRGERLRDGVRVAIIGAPNAGKSSLLNVLAQRDVAIVTPEAGTTRDVIDVHLNLGGYPVILSDTAGLRSTENVAESEGIKRTAITAQGADIIIALFDVTQEEDAATKSLIDEKTIVFYSKADLSGDKKENAFSSVTGEGLDTLLNMLTAQVAGIFKTSSNTPSLTRARHREALIETKEALARALTADLPELAAEDLRIALMSLGRITGRVHVEDLLDVIFKDFCIGK